MSGIATIGGGAASFQPVAALSVNLMPPFDYTGSHLLANCARQAQQLRRRRHEPRLEPRYDGPNREGALFCRSGTWVEILDRTTAEYEARRNDLTRPEYVRGTHNEHSRFSVLEFISVAFGLVSIRGRESQRYLCMDREGRLYGALKQNYSSECVFMEEMLENYYNLYSSCSYGTLKKPWYIALRKTGRPRKGKNSRKRRKSSHFLVVHFDGDRMSPYEAEDEEGDRMRSAGKKISRAHRYGYKTGSYANYKKPPLPRSLSDILPGTLQNQPPSQIFARSPTPLELVRRIAAQRRNETNKQLTVEERRVNRRKRRRKARLEREERQRQRRRQQLELERASAYREQQLRKRIS
uniref:FGF n=1 Tax=Parascaris univalens TaxID=6257 RepID=A0A915C269_PARUN